MTGSSPLRRPQNAEIARAPTGSTTPRLPQTPYLQGLLSSAIHRWELQTFIDEDAARLQDLNREYNTAARTAMESHGEMRHASIMLKLNLLELAGSDHAVEVHTDQWPSVIYEQDEAGRVQEDHHPGMEHHPGVQVRPAREDASDAEVTVRHGTTKARRKHRGRGHAGRHNWSDHA
ncbi:hypothetical protein ColTof4_14423 [Colletotrichum tofieldiae]|nr:hypothetical protein ColTof3_14857 [Colletotrichum tofieldiae]GKT82000.1 hypothetical protein ColTof4_14423 [Colletotrichum tofieldiae]